MSVFVVLLLLEAVSLEEGVGGVLEAGDRVSGCWRRRLQTSRTKYNKNTTKTIGS